MKYGLLKSILGACALFVAFVFLFPRQVLYFLNPTFLAPDQDETWTLYVHKRHLFGADTVFPIKARHVEWTEGTVWCVQAKDGKWYSYFSWDDGL
jgi:hypothetical protein